jgi:FKBP-type peptidyl-prolyl cis-trans isomerase
MKKIAGTMVLSIAVIAMFNATSCLRDYGDDIIIRTPEMERSELDKALSLLEAEEYDIDTTDLGVYYIVNVEGEGPYAQPGDTLRLEYIATLLNGQIFDASAFYYSDSIWEFVFGDLPLIPGFEDGLSLMNKGSETDLIIPSEFAYGENGYGPIGPYTTLFFQTRMHDISPTSD